MSSNDIAVSVRGLSKSYTIAHNAEKHTTLGEALMHRLRRPLERPERETFWALKDVSFDIKKGDVVGIIGRNGAGKSTLLKILSRITEPTTGAIDLYGRVGSLLEVGTGFHPELTGRENIYLNGAILGMKRSEITRQFDAIVDFAGVEQFLDTPVKRYSSGMYVRLAFAVAAHLNPEILIVDEVLAVGDSEFQKKCLGKMKDVASGGRTILFVSHNMAAVRQLCRNAMALTSGHLIEAGETDQVINHYLSSGDAQSHHTISLPRGVAGSPARGIRLCFMDSTGELKTQFRLGEKWRIKFEFEACDVTPECIAGVGLMTLDSVAIGTYWSKPADLSPGRYFVEFDVDLNLAPGEIQFIAGITTRDISAYYSPGNGQVTISDTGIEGMSFKLRGGLMLTQQISHIKAFNV